ncbi:Sodium/calcium exchanger 3 [Pteropus alecto]|uniref:Sodium/calcium exchanger 3 n=1 Tax=Pteropus alecto TaxID=9402 RepID=L5KE32_PTEAL|nr:Sodium/calcium exchanger 3 [Pteropus alecto]
MPSLDFGKFQTHPPALPLIDDLLGDIDENTLHFSPQNPSMHPVTEGNKTIHIKVIDDEAYEKNKNYFIELMGPRMVEMSFQKEVTDRKLTMEEEEAKRIAEMGKPVLGQHPKLEVIIEESYEFKSTVDKLIKKTNLALVVGTHSWRDQFMEAITVSAAQPVSQDPTDMLQWGWEGSHHH